METKTQQQQTPQQNLDQQQNQTTQQQTLNPNQQIAGQAPQQRPMMQQMAYRGPYPQQFMPGFQQMMGPPIVHLTPQQQQESLLAMQKKYAIKSSLTEQCPTHTAHNLIFDDGENKYCEKCYFEKEEKLKENPHEAGKQEQIAEARRLKGLEPVDKQQQIQELYNKLQGLLNNLSLKMQKKVDYLNMRQQLSAYENTLNQKYRPVFKEMKQIIRDKRLDYMTYLIKQLNQNKDKVQEEKATMDKLMKSFFEVSDPISDKLEFQLQQIQKQDNIAKKIVEKESTQNYDEEDDGKENEEEKEKPQINSYLIEAASTSIEDFENILMKNINVYTNYEDFSFAQSRTREQIDQQFKEFVESNFTGEFQLENWFNQEVLPKICFLSTGQKFIYSYKILHHNSECQLIQNAFVFPEKGRYVIAPNGHLFMVGGYFPTLNLFSNNTFILDEHRQTFVALQSMKQARADHAMILFKNQIYVLGGFNFSDKNTQTLQSLNTFETYSIAEDKWTTLPAFTNARQGHSVCQFNDKYFFIIGGQSLRKGSVLKDYSSDILSEVEVFDIEKNFWKTQYISNKEILRVLYPGAFQVSGKKIMIFGGANSVTDEKEDVQLQNGKQRVALNDKCIYFNVTTGEIKLGKPLAKPSYFISGGYTFPQAGKIFALGFGVNKESNPFIQLAGESAEPKQVQIHDLVSNQNRKVMHQYSVSDKEWSEIQEAIFLSTKSNQSNL